MRSSRATMTNIQESSIKLPVFYIIVGTFKNRAWHFSLSSTALFFIEHGTFIHRPRHFFGGLSGSQFYEYIICSVFPSRSLDEKFLCLPIIESIDQHRIMCFESENSRNYIVSLLKLDNSKPYKSHDIK